CQYQHSVGRGFMHGCGCVFGGCFGLLMVGAFLVLGTGWGIYRAQARAQAQQVRAEQQAEQTAAQALATQCTKLLQDGSVDGASQLTSPAYRDRQSLEQFRAAVTQQELKGVRAQDFEFDPAAGNGKHACRVILTTKDGGRVLGVMHLLRTEEGWQ